MAADQPLPKTDKPAKSIGIVFGIEPDFIQPEAMAVLIPVPFEIFMPLRVLEKILCNRCLRIDVSVPLHLLCVQDWIVRRLCNYGDHKGYLSIQVWLNGKKIKW